MNDDRFDVLYRFERLFEVPEAAFEGFLRRRDRKRRNQRIRAGAVGFAVFVAAVWLVTSGGPFDRAQRPAGSGDVTDPTEQTGPPHPIGVGLLGLPPEGATPSSPEHGQLVLGIGFGHTDGDAGRFSLHVYADGRVIWQRLGDLPGGEHRGSTGLIEQRLTPEGVDLVLAEVISSGLLAHDREFVDPLGGLHYGGIEVRDGDQVVRLTWGDTGFDKGADAVATTPTPDQVSALERLDARLEDLASWLPATAWEDPEFRAYVPTSYSVCYLVEGETFGRSRILELLPAQAAHQLGAMDATRGEAVNLLGPFSFWCSVMTTEEARGLVGILEDAGPDTLDDGGLVFAFPAGRGEQVHVDFSAVLPHE
jgi:hypothetical protein